MQEHQPGPMLQRFNQKFETVAYYAVDCDKQLWIIDTLKVEAIPTFIFYEKGVEVARYAGTKESRIATILEDLVSGKFQPAKV